MNSNDHENRTGYNDRKVYLRYIELLILGISQNFNRDYSVHELRILLNLLFSSFVYGNKHSIVIYHYYIQYLDQSHIILDKTLVIFL